MALRLATTPSLLADLTERLARTRLVCPLFDTQRYCRHLEAAFLRMHERYGSNLEPADMSIAATG
jgi:predicted O-linked N-acetylglucosamine transferase (SPINDLY family)